MPSKRYFIVFQDTKSKFKVRNHNNKTLKLDDVTVLNETSGIQQKVITPDYKLFYKLKWNEMI